MSLYPLVSQPLTINGCELKNRIARAPHGTGYVDAEGLITDRLIAYHMERARGGVGLTILETSVADPALIGRYLISWSDRQIERWAKLAEAAHAEGMKLFQQFFHPGPMGTPGANVYAAPRAIAATTAARPHNPFVPLGMTTGQIDQHVEWFAEGAARAKSGGIDGVEIHGAHGYLLADFLSPLTNKRTDEYGGSLENRMRFLVRTLEAVRAKVGKDYPVGVRLSGTEWMDGGMDASDAAEIASILEAKGLIDYLSLTTGSYFRPWKIFGSMHEPRGYELPASSQVKHKVTVPTLVTGKIVTIAQAEEILERGDADFVSMVRATIADPHIVRKSLEGRAAEVRPCISCNQQCVGGLFRSGAVACTVNVRAGIEHLPPAAPAEVSKTVAVVGAGPSGLEAALTAAKRGHKVEVYEQAAETGGLVCFSRRAPFRSDIGQIVDYQAAELKRLGVPVHLNSPMTPERLKALGADAIIVATGGEPRRDGLQRFNPHGVQGAGLPHVKSIKQILAGEGDKAAKAVVFDDFGLYPAVAATEHLLTKGVDVTYVTSEASLGSMMVYFSTQSPTIGRLTRYPNFRMVIQKFVQAIDPHKVTLQGIDNDMEDTVEADLVVMVTANIPRREIYDALENELSVALSGDALGHGDLGWAIASGTRAGEAV